MANPNICIKIKNCNKPLVRKKTKGEQKLQFGRQIVVEYRHVVP